MIRPAQVLGPTLRRVSPHKGGQHGEAEQGVRVALRPCGVVALCPPHVRSSVRLCEVCVCETDIAFTTNTAQCKGEVQCRKSTSTREYLGQSHCFDVVNPVFGGGSRRHHTFTQQDAASV